MTPRVIAVAAGVSCLLVAGVVSSREAAQAPGGGGRARFLNAQVEERSASGGLEQAFAGAAGGRQAPGWIAYSVPAVPGDRDRCEPDRPRRLYLEGRPARTFGQHDADHTGPTPDLVVLFRAEAGSVQKLRVASSDCEVDAGGLPVAWLSGVAAEESVGLLRRIATGTTVAGVNVESVREESALMAIALHAVPSATAALEAFAAPGQPVRLRRRAVFWLGVGRGAADTLVRMARDDQDLEVRKEAMFWLARSRDPRAIAFTDEVLRR